MKKLLISALLAAFLFIPHTLQAFEKDQCVVYSGCTCLYGGLFNPDESVVLTILCGGNEDVQFVLVPTSKLRLCTKEELDELYKWAKEKQNEDN